MHNISHFPLHIVYLTDIISLTSLNTLFISQTWDIAGNDQDDLTTTYFRGTQGVLLAYDITNRSSFESLPKLINYVNVMTQDCTTVIFIVQHHAEEELLLEI